jgi:hypothetical protein
MIVDTSALIAILRDEPEAASCAPEIENSVVRRVSAANFVEAAIIIDASRDPIASRRFVAHTDIKPATIKRAVASDLRLKPCRCRSIGYWRKRNCLGQRTKMGATAARRKMGRNQLQQKR